MLLIRGMHNLNAEHRGTVATIGNFDGVHLGHKAVIDQLLEKSSELNLPACVIIFEPQAAEYFNSDLSPARLTRLREKLIALQQLSVDRVLCLQFNKALSELTAQDFIKRILVDGLGIKYLVVGDDFRFGRGRTGNYDSLAEAGEQHGFELAHMDTFDIDGERVSSTRVREALAAGDIYQAEKLLGQKYQISGKVAHGDKRGRTIGFPTANIFLHRKQSPLSGVFAVEIFGLSQRPLQGVANIGTRPTVDGTRRLLEIHLFDFDREIYGQYVQIKFVKKLRDEIRFDSFDDLKQQILMDAKQARECFATENSQV